MKNKLITLFLLTFALTSCGSNDISSSVSSISSSDGFVSNISMNITKASSHKINPFIYGTFIEFLETCIYGGIWSEKVLDRKFYDPVNEGVSAWSILNDGSYISGAIGKDAFQGNYSPIIHNGSSIFQRGIYLNDVSYSGYFYAKGKGKIIISLSQGEEYNVSTSIDVNSDNYQKYLYEFPNTFKAKNCTYTIKAEDGDITIDSVSLMPSDNYYGMRKDTLDVLKELNSPFYRYPGGNFVSGYDFYDGIGDRDLRPTVLNRNYCSVFGYHEGDEDLSGAFMAIGQNGWYGAFDPNDFGIDEFMIFCEYLNAEPNIVVNSGLGGAQMAADEVEFCNGSSESKWGSKRLQKEPYNVRVWSIGNEMYGDWQLGYMPLNEYTKKHNQMALAMKNVDPNIEIIAVGANGGNWTQGMVSACKDNMDYISEHYYPRRVEENVKEHILALKNDTANCIKRHRKISGIKDITMAIDEYAYANAEVFSRLKDGMGVAASLNTMIENADVVDIACYSETVNATQGNVSATNIGAYMEGSGYALSLYRNNMQDYYVPISYDKMKSVDEYLEISATTNNAKDIVTFSIINASEEEVKIKCDAIKEFIKIDYVQGDYFYSNNTDSSQELHRYQENLSGNDFKIKPRTISLVTCKI